MVAMLLGTATTRNLRLLAGLMEEGSWGRTVRRRPAQGKSAALRINRYFLARNESNIDFSVGHGK